MAELISKDMIIEEVVKKYPKTVPVFFAHGLHCVGCHVANFETIEQGAMGHGITDIGKLMSDLNEVAGKGDEGADKGGES